MAYICIHNIQTCVYTYDIYCSCKQKTSTGFAKRCLLPIWHAQINLWFFASYCLSTHPLYTSMRVLSMSLVHCLFQGEKNLCAAGEHELHTGWIMNKRTACRRTGTLRIRHEVPAATHGSAWKGVTGVWLLPLQCHVEQRAQLLGKYCDFIWVRLTLSLRHAANERCATLDKQQARAAYVCMCVCVCPWFG